MGKLLWGIRMALAPAASNLMGSSGCREAAGETRCSLQPQAEQAREAGRHAHRSPLGGASGGAGLRAAAQPSESVGRPARDLGWRVSSGKRCSWRRG